MSAVRLEENLDDGTPVHGLRLDVFDIVHRGRENALVNGGQTPLEFFRAKPL